MTHIRKFCFVFVLSGLSIMALVSGSAGNPPTIPGAQNSELRDAIEHYLADDDESALPIISRLAQSGNVAAKLLLGRIDNLSSSSYLEQLDRRARVSLMRNEKGIFGENWLISLADSVPLG